MKRYCVKENAKLLLAIRHASSVRERGQAGQATIEEVHAATDRVNAATAALLTCREKNEGKGR